MANGSELLVSRRVRRRPDSAVLQEITAARKMIVVASTEAEIRSVLSPRGYDTEHLATGMHLYQAAQAAYAAWQQAQQEQLQAEVALKAAEATARRIFAEYRGLGRSLFPEPADQAALRFNARNRQDVPLFLEEARRGYEAASAPPYSSLFSEYGSLKTAVDTLEVCASAYQRFTTALTVSSLAIQCRDSALTRLYEWVRRFQYFAKVALRSRPDLTKKLGM